MEDNHLAVSIVCEGVGDIAVSVGNGNGAATEIEMVGLKGIAGFLTNEPSAIDILGGNTVCRLTQQPTQPMVRIVGICSTSVMSL